MSIRALKWAHGVLSSIDLPPTERLVLLCLAFHHNDKTNDCFPSMQTLGEECGVTSRRIQTAVDALVVWSMIQKKRGGTKAGNASNRYTLFGKPKRPEPTGKHLPIETGTKKPITTGTWLPVSNRKTCSDDRGYISESAVEEADCPAGGTEHLAGTACLAGTSGPNDVQEDAGQNVKSSLASNPDEKQSITRQRDRPARAGHLKADGTSRCTLVPDAPPVFAVELLGKMATAQPAPPQPNRAPGHRVIADRPGGCPTAYAFAVLRHLRVNGPASDGATASDMGISIGDAWRAQDQLRRIRAIEFDRIGQMVPAPRA